MKNIYLIGGGGHCKSCIDVIEQENKYQIKGIFDLSDNIDKNILGYKVIGGDHDIENYISKENYFLVTMGQIGNPGKRLDYLKLNLTTIISPRAYVSKNSTVGVGTIVMHGVIINANASVGKNCIINSKALIEHDAIIGDNCHISTTAVINGSVIVGNDTFVGSGAITKNNTTIPEKSFIKANSIFK
jgi:sugar O-acyltransferase (sialic acid O-acetyltransferase NeuD family)